MKKLFLALVGLFLTSNANAGGIERYVGADFGISYLTGDAFDRETVFSGRLNVGVKLNENVGAELSYFKSTDASGSYAYRIYGHGYLMDSLEGSYSSLGLDLFGYVPLQKQSSLLFSVGVAKYEMKLDSALWGNMKDDKTVARFGVGVEHKINRDVSMRVPVDMGDIDSATELTAGIRYLF